MSENCQRHWSSKRQEETTEVKRVAGVELQMQSWLLVGEHRKGDRTVLECPLLGAQVTERDTD